MWKMKHPNILRNRVTYYSLSSFSFGFLDFSSFISAYYHLHLVASRKGNMSEMHLKSVICLPHGTFVQKLVKDVNINDSSKIRGYLRISFIQTFLFSISKGNWELNESWNDVIPLVYLKWFHLMTELIYQGHIYMKLQKRLLYKENALSGSFEDWI